jgi:hypothetical protein
MPSPNDVIFVREDSGDREVETVDSTYILECTDENELFELLNAFILRRDLISDQLEAAKTFDNQDEAWFRRARHAYNCTREGIRWIKYRQDQLNAAKPPRPGAGSGEEVSKLRHRISELGRLLAECQRGESQKTSRMKLEYQRSVDRQFIALCRERLVEGQFTDLMQEAEARHAASA